MSIFCTPIFVLYTYFMPPSLTSLLIFFFFCRDLSEQIKKVTKDSHVRAENTELMLSFQKGKVTLPQYKVKYILNLFFVIA